ncbi:hypothetical protein [Thauera sp.]|uniref:hypothetical protein n=1 Tax=Thauera sp. TaxID=1905334 RepID=UPI0039E4E7F5
MIGDHENGFAEDLGAVLGFSAACRLIAVFGRQVIYVPTTPHPQHALTLLLGANAAARLCAEVGGQTVRIPGNEEFFRLRKMREVAELAKMGFSERAIAHGIKEKNGRSVRHIRRYRLAAQTLGLLPPDLPKAEEQGAHWEQLPLTLPPGRKKKPQGHPRKGAEKPKNAN